MPGAAAGPGGMRCGGPPGCMPAWPGGMPGPPAPAGATLPGGGRRTRPSRTSLSAWVRCVAKKAAQRVERAGRAGCGGGMRAGVEGSGIVEKESERCVLRERWVERGEWKEEVVHAGGAHSRCHTAPSALDSRRACAAREAPCWPPRHAQHTHRSACMHAGAGAMRGAGDWPGACSTHAYTREEGWCVVWAQDR